MGTASDTEAKGKDERINAAIAGEVALTEEEARAIYAQGLEAVVFALLKLSRDRDELKRRLAGAKFRPDPSTPSGMVPPYQKEPAKKRRKKPGRKPGHRGDRRKKPLQVDRRQEHRLECCPDCGTPLSSPVEQRTRTVEDIPEVKPEVTEHTIHRYYCPQCRKLVEPRVGEALPQATIGNHLLVLTAWLHYGLGNTLSQIISVLNYHLHFQVSEGGLIQMWYRLQEILYPWYRQIGEEVKQQAALFADETGWRVAGVTHWLWCFATKRATYYLIDRSRGEPALRKFFTETFQGTLITDFWGPYERVAAATRQKCLPHLLRELMKVEVRNKSPTWLAFAKRLKRLLQDALRLEKREDLAPESYASRRQRLQERLEELAATREDDDDVRRLAKRLRKYRDDLFTFLDLEGVPSSNNHAEREIRPAVIIRKNSLCNHSQDGADMQAVMMSIYRTLKLRGLDPVKTIAGAVREYLLTGKLPPLPTAPASGG